MAESLDKDYQKALTDVGVATLATLGAVEATQRHLHPPQFASLLKALTPHRDTLDQALACFRLALPPEPLAAFHDRFTDGADQTLRGLNMLLKGGAPDTGIQNVLASMEIFARALETLYALHHFPPLSRYFAEPPVQGRLESLDPKPPEGVSVGLHQTSGDQGGATHGGFCLYVPETYDGQRDMSLVVALHGGSGNGRTFMWSWLREARSRGFLLLAPTSVGPTWSLMGPDLDRGPLSAMVDYVGENWRLDRSRILLTGLSDGATYSLLAGLAEGSPFTHLAPLSGVFHPANLENGNIERARDKPIYLVHGVMDWMFPVQTARAARDQLEAAGAALVYRELEDLSHCYARDENDRILPWFDAALSYDKQSLAS